MYAVIWMEVALDELADLFVESDPFKRIDIEQTVSRFNSSLASEPSHLGESRGGNRRIALDSRYGIYFLLDDPIEGVVRVTHFWTF